MSRWADRYWRSAEGIALHYRDYPGPFERPPIICLPGLTRNARDFEGLAERLAGAWRVIAVDYRGRGLSEPDPDPGRYRPASYVADILKLIDQLGIATAVLVGTSLGGLVAMMIASSDGERVAGVLLNDVGPELAGPAVERIRSYVGRNPSFADWSEAERAVAELYAIAHPAYGAQEWRAMARRLCRQEEGGRVRFDYDPAIAEAFGTGNSPAPDLWPLLDALAGFAPTILRGELSDLLTDAVARRMAERLPDAELVTVANTGHAPALDEPEAVAAIDRLLQRVLAGQQPLSW